MTPPTDTRARADAGQQLSLSILLDEDFATFDRIIRSYPPGKHLSINTVRKQLDACGIPDSSRGGLFQRAVKAGWIAPLMVAAGGREYPVTEPSTGYSANHAHVKVYVRLDETVVD